MVYQKVLCAQIWSRVEKRGSYRHVDTFAIDNHEFEKHIFDFIISNFIWINQILRTEKLPS